MRIGFKCSRKAGRQHPSKYDSRHKTPYSSTQEMHLGEKRAFSHTYIATTKYSDRQKWINKKVTTLHILKVDACCIYSIILHLLLLFSVCMFIFMLKLFMGEEKSVKRLSCSFCLFFLSQVCSSPSSNSLGLDFWKRRFPCLTTPKRVVLM